jgi:peptidoglycan/xylan/chitin deacetylase (PgdA/CDA1 family)
VAAGCPITILMYHSVNREPDDYSVSPQRFREHMEVVRRYFPVTRLSGIESSFADAVTRRVIVTFDDAFADFREHAYPVLAEFGIPATMFVPTGYVGRSNRWDAGLPNVTQKSIMDVEALRTLDCDGLVDLGSHTVDHVRMRRLSAREMRSQATASKQWLEDTFGKAVTMFSYPYGQRDDFSADTTKALAEAGYCTAVTTCWGTRNSQGNLLALRRVFFREQDDPATVRAKIDGQHDWIEWKERVGYLKRSMSRMVRLGG